MSEEPKTATAALLREHTGASVRAAAVAELARHIARREHGPGYVGYESSHKEAAEEYLFVIARFMFIPEDGKLVKAPHTPLPLRP